MSDPNATADALRQSDLATLAKALEDQRHRAVDIVIPAKQIRFDGGDLYLDGVEPVLSADGVTDADGWYRPTRVAEEGIAAKLDIPLKYLRRMRQQAPELFDSNAHTWLERDTGSYLLRLLRSDDPADKVGVMRAMLSRQYRVIDNLDVLLATLEGVKNAGVPIGPGDIKADLTDRRMYLRISVPQISVYAPDLLAGYRSPFRKPGDDQAQPVVFAGLVITNSETGGGAYTITPRLVVEICDNGLTMTKDAMREVHLGSKLDSVGIIRWSEATTRKNLELVTAQTADAVATFLDRDYVRAKVAEMETAAGLPVHDAPTVITNVGNRFGFTDDQQKSILDHFIAGGQLTAGGVMQAITSAAQLQTSGDEAWDMEAAALPALELAATLARG